MSRIFKIIGDQDTIVGYSYPSKTFYVTNKGTTTHRTTSTSIMEVLHIFHEHPATRIGSSEVEITTTLLDKDLKEPQEPITSLSFTYSDTGAYISSIQLNDYAENPLTIDLEKKKIYIMNTNVIFDLTLNEPKDYRIDYLVSYYDKTHGIFISDEDMEVLYNLLTSFYDNPHVYNIVETPKTKEDKIKYSNKFSCSNYNGKGLLQYIVTANPNNKFTTYHVISTGNKTITLNETPTLSQYDKLTIGTHTYTVNSVSGKTVTIFEEIETTEYPYYKAFALTPSYNISAITPNTVTTTANPSLSANNKIVITGTNAMNKTSATSNDGTYTVNSVSSATTTIKETFNIPYTHAENTDYPQLYKQVSLGNILSISNGVATLQNNTTINIPANSLVQITYNNEPIGTYTCTGASSGTNKLTLTNSPEYTPQLTEVTCPCSDMLMSTSYSNNPDFPEGEFTLDKFTQVQSYIGTKFSSEYIPSTNIAIGMYCPIPETYPLDESIGLDKSVDTMTLLGLYSEVYKDKIS